ncbi:MAG: hypothetical protein KJ799_11465 [Bacteroidetes bacterium]|nr:hypothetical protein [Bacteroidota bacterium]MBU1679949.1 hypothetical protein [Bacteroidota bacterium]MBU2507326.1 hypothetical protein [Bacteroidota bacterium]
MFNICSPSPGSKPFNGSSISLSRGKYYQINPNIAKIVFLLCFIFMHGCQTPTDNEPVNKLFGTWQLKIVSGGFTGSTHTIDIHKDNYLVNFQSDNTASYLYNDTLLWTSPFYIKKNRSIYSQDSLDFIYYTNNSRFDVIWRLSWDTLSLADNGHDGFTRNYIKILK